MPTLPVPLMVTLILAYLLIRLKWHGARWCWTQTLVLACALQALIVTGRLYYQIPGVGLVQPVTAAVIPPLFYLAFLSSAIRPLTWSQDIWHLLAPAFVIFCILFAPIALDAVLPVIFIAYGIAILCRLKGGSDRLEQERLEEGILPVRLWSLAAFFLFFSAVSDALIAVDLQIGDGRNIGWINVISSSFTLMGIGLIGLSRPPQNDNPPSLISAKKPTASLHGTDEEIIERVTHLMTGQNLYRNPDLTLASLAKRLTLPAKDLSGAVNRLTGMNMSQFVNGYRINEACSLLVQDQSVTEAMLAAGFQTKSNFNREFRRITGKNPTDWRQTGAVIPPLPATLPESADTA